MGQPVRVGFIGVGGIARHHLKQLAPLAEAEVVALCDLDEAAAAGAATEHGGRVYTDHRRMLEAESLDAVYVCVPPACHETQELDAIAAGCALFVEKPVALSMDKALEVQAAIEQAGIISAVGYSMRYWPSLVAAVEYLAGRQASLVSCHRWGGIAGTETGWWRQMALSGGQLVEQATHNLDAVRWMLGEFQQVWARYEYASMAHHPNFTIPASQVLAFELANGAVGTLTCSCATWRGGGMSSWDVLLDGERVTLTNREARVNPAPEGTDGLLHGSLPELTIDEGFIRAVASGDATTIRSSYADAVRTLEVTLAANESAATGRPVECTAWRKG